ncbi:putative N-acetyltransferase family protein [Talaromyces proteolyticus]|uniref:N-acetyltransferase family protein n=1 Tax=Talaromyces proteolyticus TaxID=1131652 RepID=A0AAD4PVE9_9EURO|nr:putative N-acetyltransferase family protein [Talaromyces proteolyticus]KAH8696440.1 putative N-acetyltransferase family protein [Talaromyces proteolyticus]
MEKPEWAQRQTYTLKQLHQYFDRIALPPTVRTALLSGKNTVDVDKHDEKTRLDLLTTLQRYHLAAVPFENVYLHYSTHHTISIDEQELFHKIVERGSGYGGYCLENNGLFGTVLRSLGYNAYSAGARVNEAAQPVAAGKNWKGPKFDGWNHMVNLVTIGINQYLVDVGFGSNGPHSPIPLVAGKTFFNYGKQTGRLRQGTLLQHVNSSHQQELWHYEFQNGDETAPWTPAYAFTEVEFTPDDFEIINFFMSTHRSSWFTFYVVLSRMILDDAGEQIIGDLTLFNDEVRRRVGGTVELLQKLELEDDRVAALDKYFQIRLSRSERAGIKRSVAQIL